MLVQIKSASSLLNLLKDPYVLIAAATLTVGNMSIGVLETSLPTWVLTTFCAVEWMLGNDMAVTALLVFRGTKRFIISGIAMLPPAISYLIATAIFSRIGTSGYRWLTCFISFFVTAVGSILLPFCTT